MHLYKVHIPYREPTYKRSEHLYDGVLEVSASSPAEAKIVALKKFKAVASSSSVRWTREIVHDDIRVERASGGAGGPDVPTEDLPE